MGLIDDHKKKKKKMAKKEKKLRAAEKKRLQKEGTAALKKEEITRRRFENQSGRREDSDQASRTLTKSQLNRLQVKNNRQVKELLNEAKTSYKDKQAKFNKYCQDITETNEMPFLVMTKTA